MVGLTRVLFVFVFALVCSCTNLLLNLAHLRSLCKCPKSKIGFPILDYNKKTSRDSFSCSNSPIPSMRETKQKNTYETGTSVLTLSRGTSGTSCQADQGGHMSFTASADDSYLCWLWRSAAGRPRFPDGSGIWPLCTAWPYRAAFGWTREMKRRMLERSPPSLHRGRSRLFQLSEHFYRESRGWTDTDQPAHRDAVRVQNWPIIEISTTQKILLFIIFWKKNVWSIQKRFVALLFF